jgi:hypothetical protein
MRWVTQDATKREMVRTRLVRRVKAKRVKATRRFKIKERRKVRFLFRSGLILTQENRLRNLGLLTGASLETDT